LDVGQGRGGIAHFVLVFSSGTACGCDRVGCEGDPMMVVDGKRRWAKKDDTWPYL